MNVKRAIDRRQFVKGGLAALTGPVLCTLPACGRAARIARDFPARLVVVQLAGGNDALSALVPFRDDGYYRARKKTAISGDDVHRISDDVGFHPNLRGFARLWDAGELAVVEGCGYPDPVYSHFKAFEIWHAARKEGRAAGDGWLGRVRSAAWGEDPANEMLMHVGAEMPHSLACAAHPAVTFQDPRSLEWLGDERARGTFDRMGNADRGMDAAAAGPARSAPGSDALAKLRRTFEVSSATSERVLAATAAYRPSVAYPDEPFARSLEVIAGLLSSDFRTRVFSVTLDGFDTHGGAQRWMYEDLYTTLGDGLDAFLRDIGGTSAGAETAVLVFSEFSRRVEENHSGGTDHGAAGPMFLMGPRVAGGRYGRSPSLEALDEDGNLVYTTDFRSVYATILADWLNVAPERVLAERHPALPLFTA